MMNDKELDTFAKAWVKYISVATLHGENSTTRKGTENAIKAYKSITEDFKKSLQSLLKQAELRGMRKARDRVLRRTEIPADAKNPTRDIVVVIGEECARIINEDIAELEAKMGEK